MKLSKKNAARQWAIQKTIASGKTLGGLLVGLAAATVAGGCTDASPSHIIGFDSEPSYQANATNEDMGKVALQGFRFVPERIPAQEQKLSKTNDVKEQKHENVVRGMPLPPGDDQ